MVSLRCISLRDGEPFGSLVVSPHDNMTPREVVLEIIQELDGTLARSSFLVTA